uniref:Extracellular metalloproteinase n=1 Tax=Onygena corvina TaxID=180788 RepID=A0A0B4VKW3_9EURO|nr:metalloprotease Mep4 [Onygena corvina]
MHGLLLAGLLALPLNVLAHPTTASNSGISRRAVDINSFRLPQIAKYVKSEAVVDKSSFTASSTGDYVSTATELVKKTFPNSTFRLVDGHYTGDNGISHVHFRQTVHDIDVDNTDFNVNIGSDGKVFSFGNSFYTGELPKTKPMVKREFSEPVHALQGAVKALGLPIAVKPESVKTTPIEGQKTFKFEGTSGALSDPKAKLVYVQKDGGLVLTWRIETDIGDNWLLSYVDAEKNEKVHTIVDYVSSAQYQVYPWGVNDPTEANRTEIFAPWLQTLSPNWHFDGKTLYPTTRGNNGIAQDNPSGNREYENNYRPMSPFFNFKYPYSPAMTPPSSYKDASITQLFYTSNVFHDVLYVLGFNEKAGNFQFNNYNKGGLGNDSVILNAQDGSGKNNANFATPPDGQPGRMRMYTWNASNPERDGCFEAGIVLHEYGHGVSNRLCGGPANSRCLSALESGGMGEGWSDFFATTIRLDAKDTRSTDYTMGEWASNRVGGIRRYPYSTSLTTNPLMYVNADGLTSVHAIGTIWATMLYELLWNLIDKYGKGNVNRVLPEMRRGVPTDGRHLAIKLVLDGLALQPCDPNFVQARDAILDADVHLTKGSNKCEIWKAFAKRGLGVDAKYDPTTRTGSNKLPEGC